MRRSSSANDRAVLEWVLFSLYIHSSSSPLQLITPPLNTFLATQKQQQARRWMSHLSGMLWACKTLEVPKNTPIIGRLESIYSVGSVWQFCGDWKRQIAHPLSPSFRMPPTRSPSWSSPVLIHTEHSGTAEKTVPTALITHQLQLPGSRSPSRPAEPRLRLEIPMQYG